MSKIVLASFCLALFVVLALPGLASAHPSGNPHVHMPDEPQEEAPQVERSDETR